MNKINQASGHPRHNEVLSWSHIVKQIKVVALNLLYSRFLSNYQHCSSYCNYQSTSRYFISPKSVWLFPSEFENSRMNIQYFEEKKMLKLNKTIRKEGIKETSFWKKNNFATVSTNCWFPAKPQKLRKENLQPPSFLFFQLCDVIGTFYDPWRNKLWEKNKIFFALIWTSASKAKRLRFYRTLKFYRRSKKLFLPRFSEKGQKWGRFWYQHRYQRRYRFLYRYCFRHQHRSSFLSQLLRASPKKLFIVWHHDRDDRPS